jgi:DNA-binding MarR family transcriptional regulator
MGVGEDGAMVDQAELPDEADEVAQLDEVVPNSQGEVADLRRQVAAYVAAGADESVQRVISAVHRVSRRLNQWYDQQLADLDVSGGEWTVLSEIARAAGNRLTPTQLASLAHVAPSSMTHRLDRMVDRDLVDRATDPSNRTRVLVGLTETGWQLYATTIRESNLVEADLMRGLTSRQVEDLAHLLEQLLAGLDESALEPVRGPTPVAPVTRRKRPRPGGDGAVG